MILLKGSILTCVFYSICAGELIFINKITPHNAKGLSTQGHHLFIYILYFMNYTLRTIVVCQAVLLFLY